MRRRLEMVKQHLGAAIDSVSSGEVRIVSICAGDGRDVVGTVATHARRTDVTAWLLEADCHSVAVGTASVRQAGLDKSVQFLHADATDYASYCGLPRADVLLLCGVWGHVPPRDRQSLVAACRALVATGGSVIWTRGVRRGRWRFDEICEHFEAPQWELAAKSTNDSHWGVATHRLIAPGNDPPCAGRIFEFITSSG